jgi:hypothetical protein
MKDGEACSTGSDKGECGGMTLKQKVPITAGGLIIISALISMSHPVFGWVTVALGGLLVYAGLTGDCMITKLLCKVCPKCKAECEAGKCSTGEKKES